MTERGFFSRAGDKDSSSILAMLEEAEFKGAISLLYTRRPDAFASLKREGNPVAVYLVREGRDETSARPVGFGACAVNSCYLDGKIAKAGYLFSFRIKNDNPAAVRLVPRAYRFHFDEMRELGIRDFYTTILSENLPAIRFLERRRPSMPRYEFLGEINTLTLSTGGRSVLPPGWQFRRAEPADMAALLSFYRDRAPRYDYFPLIEEEELMRGERLPPLGSFRLLINPAGSIVASGAGWDQQSYKQYIVMNYAGPLALLRPLAPLLLKPLGYPPLPATGTVLKLILLSFLLVDRDDPALFSIFLKSFRASCGGYDMLSFSLHESHPLLPQARRERTLVYKSRLYRVLETTHEQDGPAPSTGIPYVEIGRL